MNIRCYEIYNIQLSIRGTPRAMCHLDASTVYIYINDENNKGGRIRGIGFSEDVGVSKRRRPRLEEVGRENGGRE